MEGLANILERRFSDSHGQHEYNELSEGIEISEIFHHEESTTLNTRRISNAEIVPWLNQRPAAANGASKGHGFTRIVSVQVQRRPSWVYEIDKYNHDCIIDLFELKRARQLMHIGRFICLPAEYRNGSRKQSFVSSSVGSDVQLIWTYDLMTNGTEVIILIENESSSPAFLWDILESQKRLARHPMFMAFLFAIYLFNRIETGLTALYGDVASVEKRTRHSPWNVRGIPAASGNYATLSAMMSGASTGAASLEVESAQLRDILSSLSKYQWPQGVEQPEWAQNIVKEVNECVEIMRLLHEAQEGDLHYYSRRVDIQLTATQLSISVAQDSRTLASATKDDSTAMKTLAAVTVIFLPGTFVAALFSMPLFQWDTQTVGGSVVSRQFWMYWAVTGPLTVVTLTLWFVWMRWQTRRRRARERDDAESLYCKIREEPRPKLGKLRKRARGVRDEGRDLEEQRDGESYSGTSY